MLGFGAIGCESIEREGVIAVEAELEAEPGPQSAPPPIVAPPIVAPPIMAPPSRGCELVEPPAGMVDLATLLPSAIVVAGYHRADNFTGAPLPGYEARGAWFEREAADALVVAARALASDGLRLIIHDAYRPRRASVAMVEWARTHDRMDLITDGWVAPHSIHNRGRAIDLGLADANAVALDMGSAWDQFDARSGLRGVDGPALERRLQLREAMVAAGFVPYAREWWHFSYAKGPVAPAHDQPYGCRGD